LVLLYIITDLFGTISHPKQFVKQIFWWSNCFYFSNLIFTMPKKTTKEIAPESFKLHDNDTGSVEVQI